MISYEIILKKRLKFIIIYSLSALFLNYCASSESVRNDTVDKDLNAYELYSLALSEYQTGRDEEALDNINLALQKNSNIARFYELKAWILTKMEKYDRAVDAYLAVLGLQSYNPQVLKEMAALKNRQGQYLEAVQFLKKAYAQAPDRLELLLDISDNYLGAKMYDIALSSAQLYQSLKKNNFSAELYRILGIYNYYRNNFELSVKYFEQYGRITVLKREEIILLLKSYNHIKAFDSMYALIMGDAKNVLAEGEINMFRGIYFYQLQKYSDALGQLEMALAQGTSDPLIYYYYGKTLLQMGDNTKAVQMLKKFRKQAEQPELVPLMKTDLILKDLD